MSFEGNLITRDDAEYSWEKCARILALSTYVELLDLQDILQKILINIKSNPSDMKYRELKASNKSIQTRVLSRKGGLEFLNAVGFKSTNASDQKILVLEMDEVIDIEPLVDNAITWLNDVVKSCYEMVTVSGRTLTDTCAQCIIQLRLPTGQSVQGGFLLDDILLDVLNFGKCFFIESRLTPPDMWYPPCWE
eukprot:gene3362-6656_t